MLAIDTTAPVISISPSVGMVQSSGHVGEMTIAPSEHVYGLGSEDIQFTVNGQLVPLEGNWWHGGVSGVGPTYFVTPIAPQIQAGTYSISISASGSGIVDVTGNAMLADASFTWKVNNADLFERNLAPTDVAISATSIAENAGSGAVIGTFSTSDPDVGDTFAYTLVSGTGDTDNTTFNIFGNQLRANTSLDFEAKSSHSIRVRSTDQGGLTFEKVFVITVTNVNDSPTLSVVASPVLVPVAAVVATPVGGSTSGSTLVSDLVAAGGPPGNYSDPDNDPPGIAITGLNLQGGRLWFSVNGGASWQEVTQASDTSAVLLHANGLTRLFFSPASGFQGTLGDAITFRAWDRTGGYANGSTGINTQPLLGPAGGVLTTGTWADVVVVSRDGRHAFVVDHSAGLVIVDISNPTNPVKVGAYKGSGNPRGVAVSADGRYAFFANGYVGLEVLDVGTPSSPMRVGGYNTTGYAYFVTLSADGRYAYVADGNSGLRILDVTNPASPQNVGGIGIDDWARGVVLSADGAYAYVSDWTAGLKIIDVRNPTQPVRVASFATAGYVDGLALAPNGRHLFAAVDSAGLQTIDVSNPANPVAVGRCSTTGVARRLTISSDGRYALVANQNAGVVVVDISTPSAPVRLAILDTPGSSEGVAMIQSDGHVVVADGNSGLISLPFAANSTLFSQSSDVVSIVVTSPNTAPTDIALSATSIAENTGANAVVGTLTTTDPDAGNTFTYTLVAGTGSTDNAAFNISGNQLRATASLNFEAKSFYAVRIRSTDQGGLYIEKTLTISVQDLSSTLYWLSNGIIYQGSPDGSFKNIVVGTPQTIGGTITNLAIDPFGERLFWSEVSASPGSSHIYRANRDGTDVQAVYTGSGLGWINYGMAVDEAAGYVFLHSHDPAPVAAFGPHYDGKIQRIEISTGVVTAFASGLWYARLAADSWTQTLYYTDVSGFAGGGPSIYRLNGLKSILYDSTNTTGIAVVGEPPTGAVALDSASERIFFATGAGTQAKGIWRTGFGGGSSSLVTATTSYVYGVAFDPISDKVFWADAGGIYSIGSDGTQSSVLFTTSAIGSFASYTTGFAVALDNANRRPTDIALLTSSVAENLSSGTAVGTLSTTDPDSSNAFTYTLVSGTGSTDNASFAISGSQLRAIASLDFETKSSYSVRVRSTDQGGLFTEKTFTITVTNANEMPTDIALSAATIAENAGANAVVGTLTTTDPDAGNTFTYTLVAGTGSTDNAAFNISGNQLRATASLNFEAKTFYSVRVRSTDQGNLSFEKIFTITVTNVNEIPTDIALSATTSAENAGANAVVGTLSTTDPDSANSFTYALVSGTGDSDNSAFNISGNQLRATASLNFEAKSSYSIRVRSTDQGSLTVDKVFVITVTNVNEAPTNIALSATSIAENAGANAVVGTLSTTDPDSGNSFTYSLVSGTGDTDNAAFNISGNQLRAAASLDFETKSSYSIRVRSTDQGSLTVDKVFVITVTNVNEAPTNIALSTTSIAENAGANAVVGTLSTTDPDSGNSFTYTLVSGTGDTDNSAFNISGNQLRANASLNFEAKSSYSIRVRSTDQGSLTVDKVFTITVTNVNEAPADIALSTTSIAENAGANAFVGTLSTTDPDSANSFTYTLVSGAGDTDNSAFNIAGNQLRATASLNFEAKSSYSIRVRSTDQGSLTVDKVFVITVTNVNEAPTDIDLPLWTIAEYRPVDTTISTLSTTDPDVGDTSTYALVPGVGSTDNASFAIVNNSLRTAAVLSFATKSLHSIRLRAIDQAGLTMDKVFTVRVIKTSDVFTPGGPVVGGVEFGTVPAGYAVRTGGPNGQAMPVTFNGVNASPANPGAGWAAWGARSNGSGYELIWRHPGVGSYAAWTLNAAGMRTGNRGLTLADVQAIESQVTFDITGDGRIGVPPVVFTPQRTVGAVEFGTISSGYALRVGGVNGQVIPVTFNGTNASASNPGAGWLALAARSIGQGYEVFWSHAAAGAYVTWTLDGTGARTSGRVLALSEIHAIESQVNLDITGDGRIGVPAVAFTSQRTVGAVEFGTIASGYALRVGGANGQVIPVTFNGANASASNPGAGWAAVAARQSGSGYEVIWRHSQAGAYVTWTLDGGGVRTSGRVLTLSEVYAIESQTNLDITSDGRVGAPA